MNSNNSIFQAITELADKVRAGYIMELMEKNNPKESSFSMFMSSPDTKSICEAFKYEAYAIRKYGYYGELWDGKPTKYVDDTIIAETCDKYHVAKSEYDGFFGLDTDARLDVLSNALIGKFTQLMN